jgi:hypothetical protein
MLSIRSASFALPVATLAPSALYLSFSTSCICVLCYFQSMSLILDLILFPGIRDALHPPWRSAHSGLPCRRPTLLTDRFVGTCTGAAQCAGKNPELTSASTEKCHTHVQPWRDLLSFRKALHCRNQKKGPLARFWKLDWTARAGCVTRGAFLGCASLAAVLICHMAQDRNKVQHQSRRPCRCGATRAALGVGFEDRQARPFKIPGSLTTMNNQILRFSSSSRTKSSSLCLYSMLRSLGPTRRLRSSEAEDIGRLGGGNLLDGSHQLGPPEGGTLLDPPTCPFQELCIELRLRDRDGDFI